ncbi:MAG: flagellin [Clostridiales bacterium]|nr:flagellin [Clostridiales bacterium]
MRIMHNISAMNTYGKLAGATNSQARALEKLSSGYAINRAADDAAGLAISEKMRAQIRGLEQAAQNAEDGISYLQTAEGALTEVSDMLTRMEELLVQKANGTYDSGTDVQNIELEVDALMDEIDNILANTKFNGKNVFEESVDIVISDDATTSLTISQATTTNLEALTALGGSGLTKDALDLAIDEVNEQRATYGAQQNRLEHTLNNLEATTENLQASESRIRDVDMAKEMTNYTKYNIITQAATAMLAQANQVPQSVLSLLQ